MVVAEKRDGKEDIAGQRTCREKMNRISDPTSTIFDAEYARRAKLGSRMIID